MVSVSLLPLGLFIALQSWSFERQYADLNPRLQGSVDRTTRNPSRTERPEPAPPYLLPRLKTLLEERAGLTGTFTEDFRRARRRSLLLSGMSSALLGLLLAGILARRIARPIESVSETTRDMRSGNLSARVQLTGKPDREARELALNVNALARTLEHNELERKHMIADIAHDLRTPLAVMQAKLAALEDGILPLESTEISKLYRQSEALAQLIDDLRTLSLAEAARLELDISEVNLCDLLSSVTEDFSDAADAKEVRLELVLPGDRLYYPLDSDRFRRILSNLLDNALKHTPGGGLVKVTLERGLRDIRISVSDSGQGLSDEASAQVFDRFYKGERRAGSGLGLAIVQALVRLHGGLVEADNNPGGGAVFRVILGAA